MRGHGNCHGFPIGAAAKILLLRLCKESADAFGEVFVLDPQLQDKFNTSAVDEFTGSVLQKLGVNLHKDEITSFGSAK